MVKNLKQFDMSWKDINILISEISNCNFLSEKYKNCQGGPREEMQ